MSVSGVKSSRISPPEKSSRVKAIIKLLLWWTFWLSLLVIGLLLANWQWHRATEKVALMSAWEHAPIHMNPVVVPENLSRLKLTGYFLEEETLWLDNRIHDGQIGVAVLTPLMTDSGTWWLIQRGFVPTGVDRQFEPSVTTPVGQALVSGRWQSLNHGGLVLGDNREGNRLQSLSLTPWSHLSGTVFEGVVHQESGDGMQDAWWVPSQMPPERHTGYAVQWLCLALLALVMAVIGHWKWFKY
ncbi:SURF1 family protein [Nitrincola sp. MINF-07-Sa-05]|uniref:SURF1 family protein n=1 Tax=Nitrincola salilacus TaxID=3400273 RepID=UPI00391828CE